MKEIGKGVDVPENAFVVFQLYGRMYEDLYEKPFSGDGYLLDTQEVRLFLYEEQPQCDPTWEQIQ